MERLAIQRARRGHGRGGAIGKVERMLPGGNLGQYSWRVVGRGSHLSGTDKKVWTRALELGVADGRAEFYDVPVGNGAKLRREESDTVDRGWGSLTAKRIDVVTVGDDGAWVIEVKLGTSSTCLGQLINYRRLFRMQYPEQPLARMVAVVATTDQDFLTTFAEEGIYVCEVGLPGLTTAGLPRWYPPNK